MKHVKRFLSVLLAMVMVIAMAIPSMAATWTPEDGNKLTIKGTTEGHQYGAYQIFKGTLAEKQREITIDGNSYPEYSFEDGQVRVYKKDNQYYKVSDNTEYTPDPTDTAVVVKEQSLTGLTWGEGLNPDKILELHNYYVDPDAATITDAKAENLADKMHSFTDAQTIEFADRLVNGGYLKASPTKTSDKVPAGATSISIEDMDQGYYLVKDMSAVSGQDAYTRYMLRVIGEVTVYAKSSTPSVEKKVYDNSAFSGAANDEAAPSYSSAHTNGTNGNWNDVADYSIGDKVPFMLIGTLPSTYAGYNTYHYTFRDTLSAGLTLLNNTQYTISAYAVDATGTKVHTFVIDEEYDVYTKKLDDGRTSLFVDFPNLKAIKNSNNYVIREGMKIIIEYTAELNANAQLGNKGNENSVKISFTNDPNWDGTPGTSSTPVEPNDPANPDSPQNPDKPNFPDDYPANPNEPKGDTPEDDVVVYTYWLDVLKLAQQKQEGKDVHLAGAKFKLYSEALDKWAIVDVRQKITVDGEEKENPDYLKVTGWGDENQATEVVSLGTGVLGFRGLDEGNYELKETVAPDGYNLLAENIAFTITADIHNTNSYDGSPASPWKDRNLTITLSGNASSDVVEAPNKGVGDPASGKVQLAVKNKGGNQLPVTGGMGTTLFYVFGSILVIGAGVLLVTRKRMSVR